MAAVTLTGLPENVRLQKVVFLLKSVLKRENIDKFWIREMADIRGTGLKSAKIEFNSYDDVVRAERVLDGFQYLSGTTKYPLTARVDSYRPRRRSPSPMYRSRERDRFEERYRYDRYDDDEYRLRDRSPLSRETSKLDLEIELLRKRRMIIEEERRLLLERKKLELVKEYGPNALKEFKSMDERSRSYRSPPRSRDYKPRRSPPRPARPRPARASIRGVPPKLPNFNMPCKNLIYEMKDIMSQYATGNEFRLLTRLLQSSFRKRIAILLEGKPILPGSKILEMYREQYPKSTDEELIKKHMKEVKACHIRKTPERSRNENVKKEAQEENSELHLKPTSDIPDDYVDVKKEIESINENSSQENEEQELAETGSMGSEALALHDKNDEDWVQGEHGWDDLQVASAE